MLRTVKQTSTATLPSYTKQATLFGRRNPVQAGPRGAVVLAAAAAVALVAAAVALVVEI